MKQHSHTTSSHKASSHNEPTKREPIRSEAKLPDRKATEPQAEQPKAAKANNDDAVPGAPAPPPVDETKRNREAIAAIVDRLLSIVRAELDTDRLQGGPRNALTTTVEQLVAAKNELA